MITQLSDLLRTLRLRGAHQIPSLKKWNRIIST